jgi:hypothetical protein
MIKISKSPLRRRELHTQVHGDKIFPATQQTQHFTPHILTKPLFPMTSPLATASFANALGVPLSVEEVTEFHLEYVRGEIARTQSRLLYFEPVRMYSGGPDDRRWLVPMKTFSAPTLEGYSAFRIPNSQLPESHFQPVWKTLAEIVENHLPMQWMIQPSLMEENRVDLKGVEVLNNSPAVLVGLCDASGTETHARFYGLDGELHKDPLRKRDFIDLFTYAISF